MCRCKNMPECVVDGCHLTADCDTDGFCYLHDPWGSWESEGGSTN